MVNKDLIFTFRYADWVFATSLEIMASGMVRGDRIDWVDWAGKFQKRWEFPISDRARIIETKMRIKQSRLIQKLNNLGEVGQLRYVSSTPFPLGKTLESERLAHEVAYLELISTLRESAPIAKDHESELSDFAVTFERTFNSAISLLQKERPNKVYIYNGRFLQERAVWEACLKLSIPVVFFEKFNPNWIDRYFLFNEPVHSLRYRSSIMDEFGTSLFQMNASEFECVGEQWFQDRRLGKSQVHTKNQALASGFDSVKPYFVFFHSSEDELITTELSSILWGNQMTALRTLIKVMSRIGTYDLVVRLHPNLMFKSNREIRIWENFSQEVMRDFPWVHFIAPSSDISSYRLIDQAVGILTVGSTIGVEAAFFERKSLLLGKAFHEHMEITQNPSSEMELEQFIVEDLPREIVMKSKHNALKYAVFHSQGGTRFTYIRHLTKRKKPTYYFQDFKISRSLGVSILMRIDVKLRPFINFHKKVRGL
jgi:hypothetical protein